MAARSPPLAAARATVFRVMPDHITPLWSQIEPLLSDALAISCTHTTEDVRRLLMIQRSQLWGQIDTSSQPPEVQAVVVTEFTDYPRGLFVRAWLAGARRDRKLQDDAFFAAMDAWREQHRCVGFEAIGRHGWLRKYPQARVEGLVMRMVSA